MNSYFLDIEYLLMTQLSEINTLWHTILALGILKKKVWLFPILSHKLCQQRKPKSCSKLVATFVNG